MTDAENRKKFMQLLRMGVQHKVHNQQKNHGVSSEIVGRDRALVDEKMRSEARSASQSKRGLGVADLVGWQTLAWRNAFSMEPYFYETVKGKQLRIKQVLQGEVNGFGTGLTVWPAACVLLKLLEYQALSNLKALIESDDPFVLELGSGTGVVGIAAAMLLRAGRVVLTDMDNIRFIMQDNADLAQQDGVIDKKVVVDVNVYEWGHFPTKDIISSSKKAYPDLILVSDCILPKLFPIEPLVEALTLLSKPHTRILISYEHRHYQNFQPKQRFWELMEARNFSLRAIGTDEHHPHFVAADIEVWEITPSTQGKL